MFAANYTGGQLVYPLLYDYPLDAQALNENIENTFMLGDAIKVSPVLTPKVNDTATFESYFPEGKWYNLNNWKDFVNTSQGGRNHTLNRVDG